MKIFYYEQSVSNWFIYSYWIFVCGGHRIHQTALFKMILSLPVSQTQNADPFMHANSFARFFVHLWFAHFIVAVRMTDMPAFPLFDIESRRPKYIFTAMSYLWLEILSVNKHSLLHGHATVHCFGFVFDQVLWNHLFHSNLAFISENLDEFVRIVWLVTLWSLMCCCKFDNVK